MYHPEGERQLKFDNKHTTEEVTTMSDKPLYKIYYICPKEREQSPYAVQTATKEGTISKKTGTVIIRGIKCPTCMVTFKVDMSGGIKMTPTGTHKKCPEHSIHGVQELGTE